VDDQIARESQLARLREHVARISNDRALVIAGDFNLNFQVTEQRLALLEWGADLKLRDSLAQHQEPRRWKRIDYIFYRSGRGVTLEVIERGQAGEFTIDGTPLSDHPALFVRFRIQ
jgi:endonuclease/exonuclease/phosphatase (EEP) superfamily protein YafD